MIHLRGLREEKQEENMIRLIAVAGFLAFATSAQAITPAPIPQPDDMTRKFAWDVAQVGPELMVSAWPEPPSVIPAEPSAGAITERKPPHRTGVRPITNGRHFPLAPLQRQASRS